MGKKKDHAPIHRQINETHLEELREMNNVLAGAKAKFYEISWSKEQLEQVLQASRQEVLDATSSLQAELNTFEEQYGEGTLDLDKGIYYAEDVRENK
jgi:vacuolar-type H+-ATPase subunit I/STV1